MAPTNDDILKMRAAVLYILSRFEGGIDYIKLYKLLYFAQQEHLVNYGRGIIADSFDARPLGPVPEFICEGIKKRERFEHDSKEHNVFGDGMKISAGQRIYPLEAPDLDELSQTDIECLDHSIEKYGAMKSEDLSQLSHKDRAWHDAWVRSQSDPESNRMTLVEIARAGGASPEMVFFIARNILLDR